MDPFHVPARSAAFRLKVTIVTMAMIESNFTEFLLFGQSVTVYLALSAMSILDAVLIPGGGTCYSCPYAVEIPFRRSA
jgi:hypothetical protein